MAKSEKENTAQRKQVSKDSVRDAIKIIEKKLLDRLDEKGWGTFASRHEVMGVILEEFGEATAAMEKEPLNNFIGEILDITVGGAFAIACFREGTLDW